MNRTSIDTFSSTEAGSAFYRAYDIVAAKWPEGTSSVTIESTYGSTHVAVCGPADAPPVILLPGAGATSTPWYRAAAALQERHRVYALDLIGDVGRSIARGQPVANIDDVMGWFQSVLDALNLSAPAVIAHSYGAMIALGFALRHSERLSKLVLVDPNSCFSGMRTQYLMHAVPILLRPSGNRQRTFIRWETDGQELDADWLTLLALGAEHFPRSKIVVPKRPEATALASLATATTVILAEESKVHNSRRVKESIRASQPHINAVMLPGATHHTLPVAPASSLNAAILRGLVD